VIRGTGPNLMTELVRSKASAGFPVPDLNDHFAHAVVDFSPPFHRLAQSQRKAIQRWRSYVGGSPFEFAGTA
jgi:hypothetical protein